ncbi:MAG: trimethylamine methyltransferase family protein [Methanobacteriota archaeon]|nr:MAG: trimethylamine methyltransferase family protein [Euryarchaeota archaeon]
MAAVRWKYLSRDEEDFVHEKSIETLSEIGVLVRSASVLSMLEAAGAIVDSKKYVAKIPESMVKEAMKTAPKSFSLCARERGNDIMLPTSGLPHMTTDGLTLYMVDIDTGERRDATRNDYGKFVQLADALDAIDFFWPIVTISDVPARCHNAYELWTAFENCALHVQGDCTDAFDAKRQIELASVLTGGMDELRRRPVFSVATNPISPLSFDKGAVEAQVEFAKAGVPILCHSMSMPGMSSPVTTAGTVVNVNSENIASIVISQCASRGAPHIYGSSSAPIDMRTGAINFSAPEHLFISAATGQMAKRYGRPCMVSNWGMGREGSGIQISFSESFSYVSSVFSGSDLIPGIGGLDSSKGCSMEQMVLDSYIWDSFSAFLRDFAFNEGTAALDVLREVGHGNSFLMHSHTARNFRNEICEWDREKLLLESTFSDKMMPDMRKVAKTLLKDHEAVQLESDVAKEGERLLTEYSKRANATNASS